MEIFQTIWTVLTSENESLTNIIITPFLLIESYLYFIIFTQLLKVNYSKRQKKLYIILLFTIGSFNMLFIPSPYYTYVNILLCPILSFFVLKLSLHKSFLSEIIIYAISLIVSTPLILLFSLGFKLTSVLITSIPIYRILYTIIFYLFLYVFYKIICKIHTPLWLINTLKSTNTKLFIINLLMGTLAIGIQFYTEFIYIDYIPAYLVILSFVVLITYFIISIVSLFRTSKLEVTTEELEKELLYNQTLGLLYDNIRGFKHDFNNIVQGIGGYISTNNMNGLKEYYSQILDDCQKVNNLALLSPEVINNPAIYSLFASKYHTASELGIKVNIEVFMDLSNINMKIYELTRVLGILLDNAIEASKECEEKEIIFTIRKDLRLNKQLFIVENTYLNKDVNIDEIFEKGKTSKTKEDAKNHGLGLWEVRNLVKKRKNLNLYTTKDEKYFKQQFEIYGSRS